MPTSCYRPPATPAPVRAAPLATGGGGRPPRRPHQPSRRPATLGVGQVAGRPPAAGRPCTRTGPDGCGGRAAGGRGTAHTGHRFRPAARAAGPRARGRLRRRLAHLRGAPTTSARPTAGRCRSRHHAPRAGCPGPRRLRARQRRRGSLIFGAPSRGQRGGGALPAGTPRRAGPPGTSRSWAVSPTAAAIACTAGPREPRGGASARSMSIRRWMTAPGSPSANYCPTRPAPPAPGSWSRQLASSPSTAWRSSGC
jgi:hypothetical protein